MTHIDFRTSVALLFQYLKAQLFTSSSKMCLLICVIYLFLHFVMEENLAQRQRLVLWFIDLFLMVCV